VAASEMMVNNRREKGFSFVAKDAFAKAAKHT
jgi:hypothetical protein